MTQPAPIKGVSAAAAAALHKRRVTALYRAGMIRTTPASVEDRLARLVDLDDVERSVKAIRSQWGAYFSAPTTSADKIAAQVSHGPR